MEDARRSELQQQYQERFSGLEQYRKGVWQILCRDFFARYIPAGARILDLGCGWGEFINNIQAAQKFAMDLNPTSGTKLERGIVFFNVDCSQRWPLEDASLDVVFTSNFLEHLPDKSLIEKAITEAHRCLRPGGTIICMCPNIKFVPGQYWDFWDHHIPLTDNSVGELLTLKGFEVREKFDRFLPFTMSEGRQIPLALVALYLRLPWLWKLLGKQFLLVGSKPDRPASSKG